MFLSESKLAFRFGREAAEKEQDPKAAPQVPESVTADSRLRAAMRAAAKPAPESSTTLPVPAMTAAPSLPAIQEDRAMLPIIAQARSIISDAPAEDSRAIDAVLRTIEAVGARVVEQEKEARAAREQANRLVAEKARLAEENQQMRELLSNLLRTIEQERRRHSEGMNRIGDRLRTLTQLPAQLNGPAAVPETGAKAA